MKLSEFFGFFFRYVRNPSSIGAVCPSSSFLGRKMAAALSGVVGNGDAVAELGAGTGAVTKFILDTPGLNPEKFYCVEFEKRSADILGKKFPKAKIFNDSAENIVEIMSGDAKDLKCVVSSLPLLSLPRQCSSSILSRCEDALPKGGLYVQFTYNLFNPPADKFFKNMKRIKTSYVFFNIPPARVDVYQKQ